MSVSLRPHGLQHAGLPCPSLSPRVCSDSCPLSRWCHPTISSSAVPFSSCLQSFPASEAFLWVGPLHQVAKVLELQLQPKSFQWIFRVDFLAVQGTLESFLQHHNSKALVLWCSAFFMVQLSDSYTLGSISFWKVLSLWTLLQSRNRLLSWYKIALTFQSLTSCSEFPEQCWFTFYTPLLALVFWPFISPAHIKFLFPNMWWPLLHPHETSLNSHS